MDLLLDVREVIDRTMGDHEPSQLRRSDTSCMIKKRINL